jgi:hypothetical protein
MHCQNCVTLISPGLLPKLAHLLHTSIFRPSWECLRVETSHLPMQVLISEPSLPITHEYHYVITFEKQSKVAQLVP